MKPHDKPKIKVQLLKDWTDPDGKVQVSGTIISVDPDVAERIYDGGFSNPPGGRPQPSANHKPKE